MRTIRGAVFALMFAAAASPHAFAWGFWPGPPPPFEPRLPLDVSGRDWCPPCVPSVGLRQAAPGQQVRGIIARRVGGSWEIVNFGPVGMTDEQGRFTFTPPGLDRGLYMFGFEVAGRTTGPVLLERSHCREGDPYNCPLCPPFCTTPPPDPQLELVQPVSLTPPGAPLNITVLNAQPGAELWLRREVYVAESWLTIEETPLRATDCTGRLATMVEAPGEPGVYRDSVRQGPEGPFTAAVVFEVRALCWQ